mmetsp:Transcript_37604/g.94333  ORF Transcript_37604/g.94333 Transcript_37604/m.94333 type:complete len:105 (+) Transcript_37604:293-607(+)
MNSECPSSLRAHQREKEAYEGHRGIAQHSTDRSQRAPIANAHAALRHTHTHTHRWAAISYCPSSTHTFSGDCHTQTDGQTGRQAGPCSHPVTSPRHAANMYVCS